MTPPVDCFSAYRSIVSDWASFQECLRRPQPEFFRVNRFKSSVKEVEAYCGKYSFSIEPLEPFETIYRWNQPERVASETILHWAGKYYIQDPVTVLPVLALDLQEGEIVLDMCAAPGGKSLFMAEIVGNHGFVVANDPSPSRRMSLNGNIQRLGAANTAVTAYEGQSLPEDRQYSAILLDVPCTGEGSFRRSDQRLRRAPDEERKHLTDTQTMLLEKAYRLLEPGGRLVYATCSFAPEENEAIICDLLKKTSARIESMEIDGPHDPGVTEWKDKVYKDELTAVWRIYPHHYDGGGMVFGRIRKPFEESLR